MMDFTLTLDEFTLMFINIGSMLVVAGGFYKYWVLSKGAKYLRQVYWLQIVFAAINFLTNVAVVVEAPRMWGLLAFQLMMIWAIVMGIKGLRGLNRDAG